MSENQPHRSLLQLVYARYSEVFLPTRTAVIVGHLHRGGSGRRNKEWCNPSLVQVVHLELVYLRRLRTLYG